MSAPAALSWLRNAQWFAAGMLSPWIFINASKGDALWALWALIELILAALNVLCAIKNDRLIREISRSGGR